MPRSRRTRHMLCTCPHIFSRGSAIGTTRSPPIPRPRGPRRNRETFPTNCMRWTIWSMPTCSLDKTTRPRPWLTRWARSLASARLSFPGLTQRRSHRRAMRWSAATGRLPRVWQCVQPRSPTCRRSPILPARAGNPEAAKPDIARLGELRDKLREAKDAYWSEQVDIQARIASAWLLYAEGRKNEALKAMSEAADAEDRTEKHRVTPGVPKPARELYGEMLLDSGNAKDALAALEGTLKKEPNRLGALAGAARAAAQLGDTSRARNYFGKVVEQAGSGGNTRVEVADARKYLAGH